MRSYGVRSTNGTIGMEKELLPRNCTQAEELLTLRYAFSWSRFPWPRTPRLDYQFTAVDLQCMIEILMQTGVL